MLGPASHYGSVVAMQELLLPVMISGGRITTWILLQGLLCSWVCCQTSPTTSSPTTQPNTTQHHHTYRPDYALLEQEDEADTDLIQDNETSDPNKEYNSDGGSGWVRVGMGSQQPNVATSVTDQDNQNDSYTPPFQASANKLS